LKQQIHQLFFKSIFY